MSTEIILSPAQDLQQGSAQNRVILHARPSDKEAVIGGHLKSDDGGAPRSKVSPSA